jgi:hypothetical protein
LRGLALFIAVYRWIHWERDMKKPRYQILSKRGFKAAAIAEFNKGALAWNFVKFNSSEYCIVQVFNAPRGHNILFKVYDDSASEARGAIQQNMAAI